MGQTGSSEKNALLNSDAFTLNTKGLKNLAKGVHFEKDEDFEYTDQQKLSQAFQIVIDNYEKINKRKQALEKKREEREKC